MNSQQQRSRECVSCPVIDVDSAAATLRIDGSGLDLHGGGCGATILVGSDERQETLRPQGTAAVAEYRKNSPLGPL